MKAKINKRLMLPMFYGIMAGLVIGGVCGLIVFHNVLGLTEWSALVFELPLVVALWKSMRRGAWVYSNVRRLHSAEYYYNLGNGVEFQKAVRHYEGKVMSAVMLWMRRDLIGRPVIAWLSACVLLIISEGTFVRPVFLVVSGVVIICFTIYLAMWTMLLTARKLSYDNFGNQKG